MDLQHLEKKPDETKNQYIRRICKYKALYNLNWYQITDLFNDVFHTTYSESYYRKNYTFGKFDTDEIVVTADDDLPDNVCDNSVSEKVMQPQSREYSEEELELYDELTEAAINARKERYRLSDDKRYINSCIRRLSREDTFKDIALEACKTIGEKKVLSNNEYNFTDRKTDVNAILEISDWHYGIEFNNFVNNYNPDICIQRINKLKQQVIDNIKFYGVSKLYIANLADLIAGRIHESIKYQSKFDVVSQTMQITEVLAEFINDLCEVVPCEYVDCFDNHSRLEPIKENSLQLETLCRFIPWYLVERLKHRVDSGRLVFIENKYDGDILSFECLGHKIGGVHGDKDKPAKVVSNITLMTNSDYDMVLTAHLHHFSCDEQYSCPVISNGSLMGTDIYSKDLRLKSKATQNMIIVTPDNVTKSICRIIVE